MKKKMFTLLVMPFAFLSSSQAQITQSASDSIILECMSLETRPHTVYAKTDTTAITTQAGELLELDYPCRVYYIRYDDQADTVPASRNYFAVAENSGNVLEVKTKNDVSPNDLAKWRIIPEMPLDSFVLIAQGVLTGRENILKQNLVIKTQTEWENLITSMNSINNVSNSFAEINIDFSKYQVIAVFDTIRPDGGWSIDITDITESVDNIVIAYTNLDTVDLNCSTTQPYYIIKIPASNKPIVFIDNTIPAKNISITDLLLEEFYYWGFKKADSVHIINSQAELLTYSNTLSTVPIPTIDFTKNSVLIVGGYTGYSKYPIADITESLWQISADTYKLCIGIALDYERFIWQTGSYDSINLRWNKAIIVPKCIPNSATVLLDVNISQLDTNNLPAGTVLTRNILPDTGCYYGWIKYPIKDSIYIINSQIELNAFTTCYTQSIDFNKYSVLMVSGVTYAGGGYVTKNLQQLSRSNYELIIKEFEGGQGVPNGWLVMLLVKKLNVGSEIKLNIINIPWW